MVFQKARWLPHLIPHYNMRGHLARPISHMDLFLLLAQWSVLVWTFCMQFFVSKSTFVSPLPLWRFLCRASGSKIQSCLVLLFVELNLSHFHRYLNILLASWSTYAHDILTIPSLLIWQVVWPPCSGIEKVLFRLRLTSSWSKISTKQHQKQGKRCLHWITKTILMQHSDCSFLIGDQWCVRQRERNVQIFLLAFASFLTTFTLHYW